MNNRRVPKLRWNKFSLRTLLVFMLIVGVGLGWLGRVVQRIRNEQDAVTEIRKMGAGWESQPASEAWLRKTLGLSRESVRGVQLEGGMIADTCLACLRDLPDLEWLELSGTQVTGAGLEHLKELANLERLDLSGTQITDADLDRLNGMTSLRYLDLRNTQATHEAIRKLQRALPDCQIDR